MVRWRLMWVAAVLCVGLPCAADAGSRSASDIAIDRGPVPILWCRSDDDEFAVRLDTATGEAIVYSLDGFVDGEEPSRIFWHAKVADVSPAGVPRLLLLREGTRLVSLPTEGYQALRSEIAVEVFDRGLPARRIDKDQFSSAASRALIDPENIGSGSDWLDSIVEYGDEQLTVQTLDDTMMRIELNSGAISLLEGEARRAAERGAAERDSNLCGHSFARANVPTQYVCRDTGLTVSKSHGIPSLLLCNYSRATVVLEAVDRLEESDSLEATVRMFGDIYRLDLTNSPVRNAPDSLGDMAVALDRPNRRALGRSGELSLERLAGSVINDPHSRVDGVRDSAGVVSLEITTSVGVVYVVRRSLWGLAEASDLSMLAYRDSDFAIPADRIVDAQ